MKAIPTGAVAYRRTRVWDQETIPEGLKGSHTTKDGCWARVCVLSGALEYEVLVEPGGVYTLVPGVEGVIEPQVPHRVRPLGEVSFYVEFWKAPASCQDG